MDDIGIESFVLNCLKKQTNTIYGFTEAYYLYLPLPPIKTDTNSGRTYRVAVCKPEGGGNDNEVQIVIVKTVGSVSDVLRKRYKQNLIKNECVMYDLYKTYLDYSTEFSLLHANADVSFAEQLACYANCNDENQEFLILAEEENFRMEDARYALKSILASLVIRKLAIQHSICLYMKTEGKDEFTKSALQLTVMLRDEYRLEDLCLAARTRLKAIVEKMLYSTTHKSRMIRFIEDLLDVFESLKVNSDLSNPSETGRTFTVICHGEVWIPNLLFSEKEDEVRFCDPQLAKPASIIYDLSFFLCTSCDCNQFDNLIKEYYECIARKLNFLFTKDNFQHELNIHFKYGLASSLIYLSRMLNPAGDLIVDLEDRNVNESIEMRIYNNLIYAADRYYI